MFHVAEKQLRLSFMYCGGVKMPKESEEVTGYLFTHVTCPECSDEKQLEGDVQGDTIECECGTIFIVRVM